MHCRDVNPPSSCSGVLERPLLFASDGVERGVEVGHWVTEQSPKEAFESMIAQLTRKSIDQTVQVRESLSTLSVRSTTQGWSPFEYLRNLPSLIRMPQVFERSHPVLRARVWSFVREFGGRPNWGQTIGWVISPTDRSSFPIAESKNVVSSSRPLPERPGDMIDYPGAKAAHWISS